MNKEKEIMTLVLMCIVCYDKQKLFSAFLY